jgi:hypothetical protein
MRCANAVFKNLSAACAPESYFFIGNLSKVDR